MDKIAHEQDSLFVVTTGDNVYNDGIASDADPLFAQTVTNIYDGASLNIPWYATMGNHDWYGDVLSQIADGGDSLGDERWHGKMSFSKEEDGTGASTVHGDGLVEIFYIDTSPWKPESSMDFVAGGLFDHKPTSADWDAWHASQLTRLESALLASTARWKFLVGHHGIYSYSTGHGSTKTLQPINDLLRRYGVHAYFSGHDHTLQAIRLPAGDADAPLYVTSGAGSSTRKDIKDPQDGTLLFSYESSGFVGVSVMDNKMIVTYHDMDGNELYSLTKNWVGPPTCRLPGVPALLARAAGMDSRCYTPSVTYNTPTVADNE